MSLLTLLISQPTLTTIQRTVEGKTVAITLDVLTGETLAAEAEATTHPVEDGADITDHVILRPKKLTIKGEVTETPFTLRGRAQGAIASATGAVGNALAGALGVSGGFGALATRQAEGAGIKALGGLLGAQSDNRQNLVYQELDNARKARLPVTIVTGLTHYDNYLITSFSIDRDASAGKRVRVSVTCQELLKATSRTVKVPIPKIRAGVKKAELGRQKANPLDGEKGKRGSLAFKGLQGLGFFKGR